MTLSEAAPLLIAMGAVLFVLGWMVCGAIAVKMEDDGLASPAPIAKAYIETWRMMEGPLALFDAIRTKRRRARDSGSRAKH